MKCKICELKIPSHKTNARYCSDECKKEGKRLSNREYYRNKVGGEVRAYANTPRRNKVKMLTTFEMRKSRTKAKVGKWNERVKEIWKNC